MSDEVEKLEPAEDDLARAERLMREAASLLSRGVWMLDAAIMIDELRILADRMGKIRERKLKELK